MEPTQPKKTVSEPFSFLEDDSESLRQSNNLRCIQFQGVAPSKEPVFFEAEHGVAHVAAVTGFGQRPKREGSLFNRTSQDGFIVRGLTDGALGVGVVDGHYDFGHIATKFLLHRLETGWGRGESSLSLLGGSSEALAEWVDRSGRSNFYQYLEPGKRFLGIGACVSTTKICKDRVLITEHLGDTRVTVIRRSGEYAQVTYESWDHNVAGEDQRKGGPARFYTPQEFSTLTRKIAPTNEKSLIFCPEQDPSCALQKGDWVILSSDGGRACGVSSWVTMIAQGGGVKEFIAHAHCQLENNRAAQGYADDYTLVALEIR